jgi:curved DNA-binding protein CbpA
MRAIERHGGAMILERAFLGFAALPESASRPWRQVLGISTTAAATWPMVEERFRSLVQIHHPDKGGDRNKFEEIVQARDAARLELAS